MAAIFVCCAATVTDLNLAHCAEQKNNLDRTPGKLLNILMYDIATYTCTRANVEKTANSRHESESKSLSLRLL